MADMRNDVWFFGARRRKDKYITICAYQPPYKTDKVSTALINDWIGTCQIIAQFIVQYQFVWVSFQIKISAKTKAKYKLKSSSTQIP